MKLLLDVEGRLDHVLELKPRADRRVGEAREHTEAVLGLRVWAHKLHGFIGAPAPTPPREYERPVD